MDEIKLAIFNGFGLSNYASNDFIKFLNSRKDFKSCQSFTINNILNHNSKDIFNKKKLVKISKEFDYIIFHSFSAPLIVLFIEQSPRIKKYILLEPNILKNETSPTLKEISSYGSNINNILPIIERINKNYINKGLMNFKPYFSKAFSKYSEWAEEIMQKHILDHTINLNSKRIKIILTEKMRSNINFYKDYPNLEFYALGSHNPMIDLPLQLSDIISKAI